MFRLRIRRVLRRLLAGLFGGSCPGCGCWSLQQPCIDCMGELRASDEAPGAAYGDDGIAARLVRRAKHGHWRAGADVFAELLLERLGGAGLVRARFDLVTWVPADRGRRSARGGHLPEQVARALAACAGLPATRLLERRRSRAQRGLDEFERIENVRGMFVLAPRRRTGGHAPRVLVIDDVRTTGATLGEAATVLALGWYRPTTCAVVGVPRRFVSRGARGRGMSGVEPPVA